MTNEMRESDRTKQALVLSGLLAKQHGLTGSEEGGARSALTFAQNAFDYLAKGDYSGFLCAIDLAGQFAKGARKEFYSRGFYSRSDT